METTLHSHSPNITLPKQTDLSPVINSLRLTCSTIYIKILDTDGNLKQLRFDKESAIAFKNAVMGHGVTGKIEARYKTDKKPQLKQINITVNSNVRTFQNCTWVSARISKEEFQSLRNRLTDFNYHPSSKDKKKSCKKRGSNRERFIK